MSKTPHAAVWRKLLLLVLLPVLGACDSSPTESEVEPVRSFTIFAEDSVFLDLAGDTVLAVANAASSSWDLGLWRTAPFHNSAQQVELACVCLNTAATDAEVMAMSPATELPEFDEVTSAQIPAPGAAWSATTFNDKRWYRYNLTGLDNQIWPTYEVYLVKRGTEVYKVQITGYYNSVGEPRHITFRYVRLED